MAAVQGVDPADPVALRDLAEQLAVVQAADLVGDRIEEEVLARPPGYARRGDGRAAPGRTAAAGPAAPAASGSRTAASKSLSLLKTLVCSVSPGLKNMVRSQAIFQRILRARKSRQRRPSSRSAGSSGAVPIGDLAPGATIRSTAGTRRGAPADCRETGTACCRRNSSAKREVDRPDRAMEVDRPEQLGPHRR